MGKRESTIFSRASEFFRKERRGDSTNADITGGIPKENAGERAGEGEEMARETQDAGAGETGNSGRVKVCRKCGRELPVEKFSKNARSKDGLQDTCKDCVSIYWKEKYRARKAVSSAVTEKRLDQTPEIKPAVKGKTLADYTPRELMEELYRRGYEGE